MKDKLPKEKANVTKMVKGVWRDQVWKKYEDGSEQLISENASTNVITQPTTYLLAGLMSNDPSFVGGVVYHAIGQGAESWDTSGIPSPTKFDTALLDEIDRQVPDGIAYIRYGEGHAQNGTTLTILDPDRIDDSGLNGRFEPDGFFDGIQVEITEGTNSGEIRNVTNYEQDTGLITVDVAFPAAIDNTSYYRFITDVSTTPTNAIEVRTTWDYGHPDDAVNYKYIREQGLYGGDAEDVTDSGYLIDRITHERIFKDSTIKLIRFIQLIFRI